MTPTLNTLKIAENVYKAVKAFHPTLKVFLVHAPFRAGENDIFGNFVTYPCRKIDEYYEKVRQFTPFCDVCGVRSGDRRLEGQRVALYSAAILGGKKSSRDALIKEEIFGSDPLTSRMK